MPFVATADGWPTDNLPADWDQTRASLLLRPVGGVIPAGIVTVGALSGTAQTYTNVAQILWNSGQFTTQGQRWVAVDGTPANGCRNVASPRTSGGIALNHPTQFEWLHTGGNLDVEFIGAAYHDIQVYIEHAGKMYKATAAPSTGTTTGTRFLPLTFPAAYHGRIRVHLGGGIFVGIRTEQSSIVKKSPDRIFNILDGGRWVDSLGLKQASGTSYLTGGISDVMFERSGWVWAPRGMPSGYFYNGNATVTSDTAASDGSTRFFSADRKAILEADFADKPLFFTILATTDDSGRSAATGLSGGPMNLRSGSCFDWIRSIDQRCTIMQVSPPPFDSGSTPPTAASSDDKNRIEMELALAGRPNTTFVNAYGPAVPWWIGAGSAGSPVTSQQATLIGANGTDPDLFGNRFLGSRLIAEAGKTLVDTMRARRQR